ncbi:YaaR family protein [Chengkuizengella axinellae]|uniref:YaaR family protein n=1 Tax=Chengkuizengella axinellae TaxID=3064388 RepID=A0ABT9J5N2_9BACL|nr:YaaR family protein [Chengkuizengella sp. 2205SS18-9]MDP5276927.1 YaaR family protein [Chengkuizengella sp. 2205SS18-9]
MKINSGLRSLQKNVLVSDQTSNNSITMKNFSETLQHQERFASSEQLKQAMLQIEIQGKRLTKSMTVRELFAYKNLVRRFMEESVRNGIQLKNKIGKDRRGRGRRYKILEEVDQSLLQMTDDLLKSEQGRIEILQKVGEIRGMLINLLF